MSWRDDIMENALRGQSRFVEIDRPPHRQRRRMRHSGGREDGALMTDLELDKREVSGLPAYVRDRPWKGKR